MRMRSFFSAVALALCAACAVAAPSVERTAKVDQQLVEMASMNLLVSTVCASEQPVDQLTAVSYNAGYIAGQDLMAAGLTSEQALAETDKVLNSDKWRQAIQLFASAPEQLPWVKSAATKNQDCANTLRLFNSALVQRRMQQILTQM